MDKIIVIDLDGTLLNSNAEISKENREAIKRSKEKGAKIMLASGQTPRVIKSYALDLEADKYIICGNGAIIYDIEKNETIYQNFIPKEKVLKIIKILEENNIYYSVYTEKAILCKNLNYNVLAYNADNSKKEENKKTNISIIENVYEYIDKMNIKNIYKINFCEKDETIFNNILRKMEQIHNVDILNIPKSVKKVIKTENSETTLEYFYTDISNKNVNKWTAIQYLMKKMKFEKEDIIAIGDNANDKMMIENAGIGIVMGDGALVTQTDKGKIVSGYNENGVAEGIEKYYLKR